MAGRTKARSETPRPGKTKKLGKTVIALAATALVEKAIQKAAEDPRVRRKAKALGKAVQKRVGVAGKKIIRVAKSVGNRAPKARRAASRRLRSLIHS
jgi:hypothetical protein